MFNDNPIDNYFPTPIKIKPLAKTAARADTDIFLNVCEQMLSTSCSRQKLFSQPSYLSDVKPRKVILMYAKADQDH